MCKAICLISGNRFVPSCMKGVWFSSVAHPVRQKAYDFTLEQLTAIFYWSIWYAMASLPLGYGSVILPFFIKNTIQGHICSIFAINAIRTMAILSKFSVLIKNTHILSIKIYSSDPSSRASIYAPPATTAAIARFPETVTSLWEISGGLSALIRLSMTEWEIPS